MPAPPLALGLCLCDRAIVEEGTRKISLIGLFSSIRVQRVPARPPPFFVWAAFTDGDGEMAAELVIERLETNEEVYSHHGHIDFADRFTVGEYLLRVGGLEIPALGPYQAVLFVEGQWAAHRRFEVRS